MLTFGRRRLPDPALYELVAPLLRAADVPVAVFGAFAGLLLRFDFDVYARLASSCYRLSAKNAILIVEFANARLEEGGRSLTLRSKGAAPHATDPQNLIRLHPRLRAAGRRRDRIGRTARYRNGGHQRHAAAA
jgi:hypothetical protein